MLMANQTYNTSSMFFVSLLFISFLSGCAHNIAGSDNQVSTRSVDVISVPDAIPRPEARSKYGNPGSYVISGKRYYTVKDNKGFTQRGLASWYGKDFHGKRTSSGETYDMHAMTAAHKTLILPAYVEVTNLDNNKKVIVKVNDRGPFHEGRIIDLSYVAAKKLGIVETGTVPVEIRIVEAQHSVADVHRVAGGTHAPVESISMPRIRPVNLSRSQNLSRLLNLKASKDFFIQIGAFSKLNNAENLLKKLSFVNHRLLNISEVTINGQLLHRLRVGPFLNIEDADKIIIQLKQLREYQGHTIVN